MGMGGSSRSCSFFSVSSFLLIAVILSQLFIDGDSTTYGGDIEALKELKQLIDPKSMIPGSCLSSWDFSVDPCDHIFSGRFTCGLRCDIVVSGLSRVTELSLDHAGYSAFLSAFTFSLPYLQILDLSYNSFTGLIPKSLSSLTRLRRLALSSNSFSGEIPTSIGFIFSLEELILDDNRLSGSIPSSFKGLLNLKRLEIQGNQLSGEVPDLGPLKNLKFLDASNNAFSGQFPETLPESLFSISMRNNHLQGNLPEIFGNMGSLQVLDLSHNEVSGSISSALFDHPSVQQLTLSYNKFTSIHIPRNNGANSELIAVDLSNNDIQGLLPIFVAMMPKLSALSVENNKFSGRIPTLYAQRAVVPVKGSSQFVRLLLGGNYLFGPIPRPLLGLKPGFANVSLVNNCLYRCPSRLFFCHGGSQKPLKLCKSFGS
ncbi:hypothetical protein Scep_000574 [Stephania cephalantha]|uniref:Uncharacterized protein n=1 Tax=Stephania cephalantha TaxID=152367 RepID=A0AAP0Q354_9MAGN